MATFGGPGPKSQGRPSAGSDKHGGDDETKMLEDNVDMVIRVQTMIRRFLARRKYKLVQSTNKGMSKYFKAEEARETLGGQYAGDAELETRTHTYSTGAVYKGQWKNCLK